MKPTDSKGGSAGVLRARRLAALPLLSLFVVFGESCADLPDVPRNDCGNGVVEAAEECDRFEKDGVRCRGADEAFACRWDCTNGKCPSGFACSPADKICRQPMGTFAAKASSSFEASAARLQLADFDGDGRADLLAMGKANETGQATTRLFFFGDPTSPPAKSIAIRANTLAPFATDVDADGRADLVFSAGAAGMNVMLGRADRTLYPVGYARFPLPPGAHARLVRVRGLATAFGQTALVFAEPAPGSSYVTIADLANPTVSPVIAPLAKSPSAVLVAPIGANLVDGVGRECEEVLWAWTGSSDVELLEPCDLGNKLRDKPTVTRKALSLPGDTVARVPVPIDLNDDGHLDLLIVGKSKSWVAFGRGDGTFSSKLDLSATTESVAEMDCTTLDGAGKPVVEGDACLPLAGWSPPKEGRRPTDAPLVVTARYVLALKATAPNPKFPARISLSGFRVATRENGEWTNAVVDDLNGNGWVDVVAGSTIAPDLDFFNGTPYGLLNPSKITTDGPTGVLTYGDYDGDLIPDLGFVEIGVGGPDKDAIAVSYGRFMGLPEAPFRMGIYGPIAEVGTAKLGGINALEQIGAIVPGESDDIVLLDGNGDRQLLSPFSLAANVDGVVTQSTPLLFAPGRFDADGHMDLGVLGYDLSGTTGPSPLRPWFVGGKSAARFNVPAAGKEITSFELGNFDPASRFSFSVSATVRAADLDGDGRDELVAFAPEKVSGGRVLVVAKLGAKTFDLGSVLPVPGTEKTILPDVQLELADLDGDKKPDAILYAGGGKKQLLGVAWGDGKGGLDVSGLTTLTLPETAGKIRGFSLVALDPGGPSSLAVVAENGVWLVRGRGRVLASEQVAGPDGGQAIGSGDVDGDGVADLLVSHGTRVSIYLGVAKKP